MRGRLQQTLPAIAPRRSNDLRRRRSCSGRAVPTLRRADEPIDLPALLRGFPSRRPRRGDPRSARAPRADGAPRAARAAPWRRRSQSNHRAGVVSPHPCDQLTISRRSRRSIAECVISFVGPTGSISTLPCKRDACLARICGLHISRQIRRGQRWRRPYTIRRIAALRQGRLDTLVRHASMHFCVGRTLFGILHLSR